MLNKVEIRRRRKETLITIAFSIFSVLLIYVAVATGWNPVIVPIIAGELGFAWWAYTSGFRTYEVRAFIVTVFACVNITFYGVYAENFMAIIPTLCVFALLFSLYEVTSIYYIVVINSFTLMLYHLFVLKSFVISDVKVERERMVLQLLSYFVLLIICIYQIRSNEARETDMTELQNEVSRTQKIKDDFVANASHELRTPINTITGLSEILLQEDLSEDIHHDVLDVQMTGFELQTIVSDILDYSALQSRTLELNPRAYNITSTLNDIMNVTVFQNREKKLELIFDCDPSIPRLLYGDEAQIRRVINNLIGNAIKFTSAGGVRVLVGFRKESYGVNLIVRVKDTGIGMSEAQQEHVFQSFYQADSDRNRRVEGLGLGLTISSELIKKMGGFMYVNSELGKGSEFSFSIPQEVRDERPCIEVANAGRIRAAWYYDSEKDSVSVREDYLEHIQKMSEYLKVFMFRCSTLKELKRRLRQNNYTHLIIGTEEYKQDPIFFDELAEEMPVILEADREYVLPDKNRMHVLYKPYNAMTLAEFFNGGDIVNAPRKYQDFEKFEAPDAKILVVDDNLMNLKVVEGLLRKFRIRITAASSGEEALKIIEGRDFDFVFMDHMMPGMDGIECLHAIRRMHGTYYQTVPIIALTANAIAGAREMFLEEGFADFVAKPIDNALLDEVLRKYIPQEKQIPVSEKETSLTSNEPLSEDDIFASMEGIDKKAGLTYCGGSIEDYIDMAKIYYESGARYYQDLIKYHEEKDWKNYSILTHAIKSTSKTIGATKLSEIAYKEELASKEEDATIIEQYHESLLKEYRRVLDMIGNNPKIVKKAENTKKVKKKKLTKKEWTLFCTRMKEALESFESGSVHDVVGEYEGCTYKNKELSELCTAISEKVEAFDFTAAIELLGKFKGEIEA